LCQSHKPPHPSKRELVVAHEHARCTGPRREDLWLEFHSEQCSPAHDSECDRRGGSLYLVPASPWRNLRTSISLYQTRLFSSATRLDLLRRLRCRYLSVSRSSTAGCTPGTLPDHRHARRSVQEHVGLCTAQTPHYWDPWRLRGVGPLLRQRLFWLRHLLRNVRIHQVPSLLRL
ncbi:hypothetical protein LTR16_006551, partial [Cryomyces antarcticus]